MQSGLMGIQDANVDTSWDLAAQLYSTKLDQDQKCVDLVRKPNF